MGVYTSYRVLAYSLNQLLAIYSYTRMVALGRVCVGYVTVVSVLCYSPVDGRVAILSEQV